MTDVQSAIGRITTVSASGTTGASLPMRYWRQQAHLVAPAVRDLPSKALGRGTEPAIRHLSAAGIDAHEFAECLGISSSVVTRAWEDPPYAPTVVLDGEDGVIGTEQGLIAAARSAGTAFRTHPRRQHQLRFFRPVNPRHPLAASQWATFFEAMGDGECDGLIIPKVENRAEVEWAGAVLDEVETHLKVGQPLRLGMMVESAKGAITLHESVEARPDRICCVIVGAVDYAADVGVLGSLGGNQQIAHLRHTVIEQAASAAIPAIDGMTLEFPVADAAWSQARRHDFVLDRAALVYQEARSGIDLGMRGKWVGHPIQLLAVLLAFAEAFSSDRITAALREAGDFADEVARGTGASIIGGRMGDAATDARVSRYVMDARRMGYDGTDKQA